MAVRTVTEELWLLGLSYPIILIRKRIKNVYLRVSPDTGEVRLSAPLRMSKRDILDFVERNLSWMKERRQKILYQNSHRLLYVTGDCVPLWGKSYPLTVLVTDEKTKSRAEVEPNRIVVLTPPNSTPTERQELIKLLYRRELINAIAATHREHELNVGQIAYEYHVRDMKTRWGTCNVRARRIWLSLNLAKYPPRALAYVMIHELTHLLERNHNARFWRLVGEVCPQWREIRHELTQPPI